MVTCSVLTCKRRSSTSNLRINGVSYHMFPKDSLWREQWRQFCNKDPELKPSPNSVVCSDHFKKSCWVPLANKRRKLIDGAVPTICLTLAKKNDNSDTTDMDQENENNGKIILGPGEIPSPSQIEKIINVHPQIRKLKQKLELQTKKIKRLHAKLLYVKNKLTSTEEKLETYKIESLKYKHIQLKLKLKKNNLLQKDRLEKQLIPSVKRVLIIKKTLFNT